MHSGSLPIFANRLILDYVLQYYINIASSGLVSNWRSIAISDLISDADVADRAKRWPRPRSDLDHIAWRMQIVESANGNIVIYVWHAIIFFEFTIFFQ